MDALSNIPAERFPRHIAIIMDGNGRWAVRRGLERIRGHQQGAHTVRNIVTECARLRKEHGGPDFLTLYSFSLENWKRPVEEVTFLMDMYITYLRQERKTMMDNNIRFRQIGRLDNLPDPVLDRMILPATRLITRASLWLRWLQRGHVHSYVLYILVTVIVALLVARGELR